jgi:hypothetical protein
LHHTDGQNLGKATIVIPSEARILAFEAWNPQFSACVPITMGEVLRSAQDDPEKSNKLSIFEKTG